MYIDLHGCPHVRSLEDQVPDKSMFVHRYLSDHLLDVVKEELPLATTKRILKDALLGLNELHKRDIVHGGWSGRSLF